MWAPFLSNWPRLPIQFKCQRLSPPLWRPREQAGRPLSEVLADALSGQDLVLVIDNCEHVVDAAAELAVMLNAKCPRLRVLATSRNHSAWTASTFTGSALSLPSAEARSAKDLQGSDAVTLFAERARARDSTFCLEDPTAALVALVCRRLDGVPLALELAAARVASMSLAHLEDASGPEVPPPHRWAQDRPPSPAHPAGHYRLVI